MATAASLQGIQDNGHRWRAVTSVPIPHDVPSLFRQCETSADVVLLAHQIMSDLCKALKRKRCMFPARSLESLNQWIDEADETFVWGDIENVEKWADDELADGLDEELIYRLDELYDWADYWRVCFRSSQ